jgi:hypothetical protein
MHVPSSSPIAWATQTYPRISLHTTAFHARLRHKPSNGQDAVSAGTLQQCFGIKNLVLLKVLSHPMISNAVNSEVTIHLSFLRSSFGQVQIKHEDLFLNRIFQ